MQSNEYEKQIRSLSEGLDILTEQNGQLQLANTRRENEIKELENLNDELLQKLESQQFEIEFRVREEMSSKIQMHFMQELGNALQSEDGLKNVEDRISKYMSKYTDQENQILKLRDDMAQLTFKLKQNDFQLTQARLNQLGDGSARRNVRLSQASMTNMVGDDDAS